jgi:hypothetical protein
MTLQNPQTIIFWKVYPDGLRRATAIRNNTKRPEQTKVFKYLKNQLNEGKTTCIGWIVYKPGPMEAQTIKPGTPINNIL